MSKEKEIVIKLDENKKVVLKFVFENNEWVCRASDEFINDLDGIFKEKVIVLLV